jgi:predicted  nucleic acid-binding Zn-ribbon protein
MDHEGLPFVLTYDTIRRNEDRLKNIERDVRRLVNRDEGELAQLRAEIVTLQAAAKTSDEEKAAMDARIKAAKERSQALEDKERGALPPST